MNARRQALIWAVRARGLNHETGAGDRADVGDARGRHNEASNRRPPRHRPARTSPSRARPPSGRPEGSQASQREWSGTFTASSTPIRAGVGRPFPRGYGCRCLRLERVVALKTKAIVAGFDWGARTADILAALWPERCKALVSVSGYLITNLKANSQPLPPVAEWGWWYQYYFATERGRLGYDKYRSDFAKLIWKNCSPKWSFDDATFARTATAIDNPDHVAAAAPSRRRRRLSRGAALEVGASRTEPFHQIRERGDRESPNPERGVTARPARSMLPRRDRHQTAP